MNLKPQISQLLLTVCLNPSPYQVFTVCQQNNFIEKKAISIEIIAHNVYVDFVFIKLELVRVKKSRLYVVLR